MQVVCFFFLIQYFLLSTAIGFTDGGHNSTALAQYVILQNVPMGIIGFTANALSEKQRKEDPIM